MAEISQNCPLFEIFAPHAKNMDCLIFAFLDFRNLRCFGISGDIWERKELPEIRWYQKMDFFLQISALVTQPKSPKGVKDKVKHTRRAQRRSKGLPPRSRGLETSSYTYFKRLISIDFFQVVPGALILVTIALLAAYMNAISGGE